MELPNQPTSYSEAATDRDWVTAMEDEIDSINRNQTWKLVNLPPGRSVISTRWLYKTKIKANGSLEKRKARLVARGNEQQHGLDFEETFALVCKWGTIRTLVAIAVQQGWQLFHLDVRTAFLHGELTEEVYVTQPQGFVDPDRPHMVCRLHKALYGLKQAP
jgi:hypothetical protein